MTAVVISIVITIGYIMVLQYVTMPMLYLSMCLIFFLLGGTGVWAWVQKDDYPVDSDTFMQMQVGAYVMWGLTGAYLICVMCCWNNITLSARLMECASEFIGENKKLLLSPLFSYFNIAWFFAFWLVCAVYLYTIGDVVPPTSTQFFCDVTMDDRTFQMMWYFLFCLFWAVNFINGTQKFLVAAACALWFFDRDSDGKRTTDLGLAAQWTYWNNVGSVAFGSLLIAIVQFIRAVVEYVD